MILNLNSYGYATYASTNILDFSDDSEFSAWQVTNVSGDAITFSKITGAIAPNTGVLLMGTPNTEVTIKNAPSANFETSSNKLEGITTATAVTTGQYYGLKGNAFVPVNAGTVPAGKALLPADDVNVRAFTFVFEEETSSIHNAQFFDERSGKADYTIHNEEGAVYDLSGRRVAKPSRGIYVKNGKKVVIK